MPMQWQVNADGGYMANPDLSKKLREQAYGKMVLRQFATPIEGGFGKKRSNKVQFDRIDKVSTAGGTVSETDTIPVTKMVVSQGEVVVEEYANSVEYTGKLDACSQWDPSNVFQRRLLGDMAATLDVAIRNLLRTGGVVYTPTTATAGTFYYNGTTAAAGAKITVYHLKRLRENMREMNIEPFDDQGNYVLVGGPGLVGALHDDSEWRDAAHYGDPDRIFTGEAGNLYGFRVVEETQSLLSQSMPAGAAVRGETYALGADAFVEAVSIPPELRAQNADYGRDQGIAWYALLGYALTWDETGGATSWASKASASGKARFIRIDGT